VVGEFGLASDYTNQIYFEQTFDSTAVTGRVTVQDPRARLVAEATARMFGAQGAWTFDASNTFGFGPTVLRDAASAAATTRLSNAFRARADGVFEARRDDTFDTRRQDQRAGGGASLLWTSPDRASGARVFGRLDGLRSAEGTLALFPDYDYRQLGVELDRFGLAGHGSVLYSYGTRAFPDTSARDYHEHQLSLDGRWRVSDPVRLELNAFGNRRIADQDSAIGDRFVSTDSEVGLIISRGETFEWGAKARVRGQVYDAPTPTFFNLWIWRYGLVARKLPEPLERLELRPEIELLRTPNFGGVPPGTSAEDLQAVADEEYDQLGLTAEAERMAAGAWWWGTLAGGHRHYLDDEADSGSSSARSSFWFAEGSGYAERRLTGRVRMRATFDLRFEFHRVPADNLTSLDVTLDLRIPL
jgi:hypothetical protein